MEECICLFEFLTSCFYCCFPKEPLAKYTDNDLGERLSVENIYPLK